MTGVTSQHNIKNCRILVGYKDYVDVHSKDTAAVAPHLSWHANGIRKKSDYGLRRERRA